MGPDLSRRLLQLPEGVEGVGLGAPVLGGASSLGSGRGGGLGEFPSAREALPRQPRPSVGERRRGRRGGFIECMFPTLPHSKSGVPPDIPLPHSRLPFLEPCSPKGKVRLGAD